MMIHLPEAEMKVEDCTLILSVIVLKFRETSMRCNLMPLDFHSPYATLLLG